MFCPNCKQEHDGKFCPECGTKLIDTPAGPGGINVNLGDANAISGGITVNTTYINERKKTHEEIEQEKRILFMNLCNKVFEDGIFEEHEVLQVENERQRLGLDKTVADNIINLARQSALFYKKELSSRDAVFMKIVSQVIHTNNASQIKSIVPKLEALTEVYRIDDVLFKYNLVLAAYLPEKIISAYENEKADNYWQTYWVFIAYLKKGEVEKAEKAASRLSLYKDYPDSNEALLSSFISTFEFGNEIARDYLAIIENEPCSPALNSFYEALMMEIDPEKAARYSISANDLAFYSTNIVHIDNPFIKSQIENEVSEAKKRDKKMKELDELVIIGGDYYNGRNGRTKDFSEAVKWFSLAAEQGHAMAQYDLGHCYYEGLGVTRDSKKAVKWLRLSAEQGYADAQFELARCYCFGEGVPQDFNEAARWYRLAANQGGAVAQMSLGLLYEEGEVVPQDYKEAAKWYSLAADQGDAVAQVRLGLLFEEGKGVLQDYRQAEKWYLLAANKGNSDAQYYLGKLYYFSRGTRIDKETAMHWWRKAADQGNQDAIDCLNGKMPEQ